MSLSMVLKFNTSVAEVLKVKVRKFLGLIPSLKKLQEKNGGWGAGGGLFCIPLILNMLKKLYLKNFHDFIYHWSE